MKSELEPHIKCKTWCIIWALQISFTLSKHAE